MAEPASLNLTALQAVVTWVGTDGQAHHLYRHDNVLPLQVTLDVYYDRNQGRSGCTGLFTLRVPVDLKDSPHDITPLLLYIRPERVTTLLCQQSDDSGLLGAQVDDVDALVRAKLGPQIVCLKFVLNHPADVVVPCSVPLVPTKQRPHGEQMDLLANLAQITSFSIHVKSQDISSLSLLGELSDAMTDPAKSIQSDATADDIASLYSGQGGRILKGAGLSATRAHAMPPLSPPSYENVGEPPPMAPLDEGQGKMDP